MEYERLKNETDAQLFLRICRLKDQIGTWQDVADILNELTGNSYSESTWRKRYQKERYTENDTSELQKERYKLQTLNLERNNILRKEARRELYFEYIAKAITTLPLPEFEVIEVQPTKDFKTEYLLTIADVHYGAEFTSENNEYSRTIAQERFEFLLDYTVEFIKKHKLSDLYIVSLGDLVQGMLRMKDLQLNNSSVVSSVVEISHIIANFLNQLSKYVTIHYYHTPTANHTQLRFLQSKANELPLEDLEYIIGHYIKDVCSNNSRINVHLADEGKQYIDIPIAGYSVCAMHGHQIKNLEDSLKDLSMLKRDFVDYLLLGHTHADKIIPGQSTSVCNDTEILISPSFVGSDPYSDTLFKSSKAAAKIYGFNYIYGLTETYKFILN